MTAPPLRLVVMGVAGCGKSTYGAALAAALGVLFRDADSLHSPQNIAKMAQGQPLTDADRWPWLGACAAVLAHEAPVVLACSALRRRYRDVLRLGTSAPLRFLLLTAGRDLLAARLTGRKGHFMPAGLLDSQLATLEPPGPDEAALTLDASRPVADLVAETLALL